MLDAITALNMWITSSVRFFLAFRSMVPWAVRIGYCAIFRTAQGTKLREMFECWNFSENFLTSPDRQSKYLWSQWLPKLKRPNQIEFLQTATCRAGLRTTHSPDAIPIAVGIQSVTRGHNHEVAKTKCFYVD